MTQARNRIYSQMMLPWYEEVNIYGLQLENIITLMGSDEEQQMLVDYVKQLASSRQLESLAKKIPQPAATGGSRQGIPSESSLEYTSTPAIFFSPNGVLSQSAAREAPVDSSLLCCSTMP